MKGQNWTDLAIRLQAWSIAVRHVGFILDSRRLLSENAHGKSKPRGFMSLEFNRFIVPIEKLPAGNFSMTPPKRRD